MINRPETEALFREVPVSDRLHVIAKLFLWLFHVSSQFVVVKVVARVRIGLLFRDAPQHTPQVWRERSRWDVSEHPLEYELERAKVENTFCSHGVTSRGKGLVRKAGLRGVG